MIKTLVILVILAWLVTFGLVLALISTLDDLCEYEKKIKKAIEYIKEYVKQFNGVCAFPDMRFFNVEDLLEILGDDNERNNK